jgi:hypothetical protein
MKVSEVIPKIMKLKEDIVLTEKGLKEGSAIVIGGGRGLNVFEMVQFKYILEKELKRLENLEVK